MADEAESAFRRDVQALNTQRASLTKQRNNLLMKLQRIKNVQAKKVATLAKHEQRLGTAQNRVAAAQAKLDAIRARNRADGIVPLSERNKEAPATETGPKGGRYYVAPSGEKVYVK